MNRKLLFTGLCIIAVLVMSDCLPAQHTVTESLISGSTGAKKNLVIVGDGFAAGNDQTTFNNFVGNIVMQGLFGSERHYNEDMNAFNIYQINAISQDSGVTQLSSNARCPNCGHTQPWGTTDTTYPYRDTCQTCGTPMEVIITTNRNTVLDYRYSGVWGRCWMEAGPNFSSNFNSIVGGLVPHYDFVIIVLNETGGGACGGGGRAFLTLNSNWQVIEHELGHAIGGLADEYFGAGVYGGGEPGAPNATINLNPLKWNEFVNPKTAIPTVFTAGMDPRTVGAFEGALYHANGIYRPSNNCRMRNHNANPYCSVCYTELKEDLDSFHDYTFLNSYKGDFDGDGNQDLLIHNANSVTIYKSNGTELEILWSITGDLPGWDDIKPGDKFFIGDFNADGLDDAYVFNYGDWRYPYFGMLRSSGQNGLYCIRLYELELPGWDDMKVHDKFYVADFNGDNRDDIYVFNGQDWSMGYLEMLKSTGTALQYVRRYDEELPGWDDMKVHDKFYVADFNNDSKEDLYVFNGKDWSMGYLGMLRTTGSALYMARRFDNSIPGWGAMAPNDMFFVGDINNDQMSDLYVFNAVDWSTEYLALLKSTGSRLYGEMYSDWIGRWNLGFVDRFIIADFDSDGDDDIYIRNRNWLGMLRSNWKTLSQIELYPKWIHNVEYHMHGWW